jgi:Flp pilus assembly protein TadG
LRRRRFDAFVGGLREVVAVEFALIAFPFFVLIFGLIEVVMIFILSSTLDCGVMEAARRVRTGKLQSSAQRLAGFKAAVCGNLFNLLDCDSRFTACYAPCPSPGRPACFTVKIIMPSPTSTSRSADDMPSCWFCVTAVTMAISVEPNQTVQVELIM